MARSEREQPEMTPHPKTPGCDCHICRPDESYDEQDRQVIETVLEHGWQVLLVADDVDCSDPDHHDHTPEDHGDPGPAFAYTVGLGHSARHPELMISGLDVRLMHRALNDVAERVVHGLRLTPGDGLEDVLAGVPVAVERVSDTGLLEAVIWSGWFHRRKPEALALVWPDRRGLFSWQPGAPSDLQVRQPPRWRTPMLHTGGLATDPAWDFPVPPEHTASSCTHVVDGGGAVLWAAREPDEVRGEEWTIHCGAANHEVEDMRVVHLAHLVRSAPSLRQIRSLGLNEVTLRADTDSPWETSQLS